MASNESNNIISSISVLSSMSSPDPPLPWLPVRLAQMVKLPQKKHQLQLLLKAGPAVAAFLRRLNNTLARQVAMNASFIGS